MREKKTNTNIFVTTSGDTINQDSYSSADTYKPKARVSSNLTEAQSSVRYSSVTGRVRVHTPISRRHDELRRINERLKKLG